MESNGINLGGWRPENQWQQIMQNHLTVLAMGVSICEFGTLQSSIFSTTDQQHCEFVAFQFLMDSNQQTFLTNIPHQDLMDLLDSNTPLFLVHCTRMLLK